MGYLKTVEIDLLKLPSDPNFTVKMKRRASYGDVVNARSAMLSLSASMDERQIQGSELKWQEYIRHLTASLIVEWNLTDAAEAPLSITPDTLSELDPIDGDFLSIEAQKRVGVRSQAEEIPFAKVSGTS